MAGKLWRVANSTIKLEWLAVYVSGGNTRPPPGSLATFTIAFSISVGVLTLIVSILTCILGEAASAERANNGALGAVLGLNMNPARLTAGAISLSSSTSFSPNVDSRFVNPVILP